jgi:hypothetical protein
LILNKSKPLWAVFETSLNQFCCFTTIYPFSGIVRWNYGYKILLEVTQSALVKSNPAKKFAEKRTTNLEIKGPHHVKQDWLRPVSRTAQEGYILFQR